jgi:hypothetical protein
MKPQLEASQTARDVELLLIEAGWIQAADKRNGEPAPFLQGNSKLFVINAIHGKTEYAIGGGEGQAHATPMDAANYLLTMVRPVEPEPEPVEDYAPVLVIDAIAAEPAPVIDLAAENEALRRRIAELEARDRSVFAEAPLLPAPDALMSDWGEVGAGYDDVTGDMLLDAFEQDEAEAASVIQVLSATRQRHLSEQLNVEKARLRREHMLTDQANPREASIDRLLGLLTRRGD